MSGDFDLLDLADARIVNAHRDVLIRVPSLARRIDARHRRTSPTAQLIDLLDQRLTIDDLAALAPQDLHRLGLLLRSWLLLCEAQRAEALRAAA